MSVLPSSRLRSLRAAVRRRLLPWFARNARDLPWRAEPRPPHAVWISEVMLQQTRVDTVVPYFRRFLARCPELFQPPAVGDVFAYRVFREATLQRELSASVVSSSVLDGADGPEIAIHPGQLRLDLLRSLYLTDALHRTPQIHDEPPPAPPLLPPTIPPGERP